MSTTFQRKSFYVKNDNSSLITSNGSKASIPVFHYKSNILGQWTILDVNLNSVNLTGATFTFKLAESYNGTVLLTVNNSSFNLGDWNEESISTGKISCRINLDQSGINTFLGIEESKTAYASLWATISGVNYLLTNFTVKIKNKVF